MLSVLRSAEHLRLIRIHIGPLAFPLLRHQTHILQLGAHCGSDKVTDLSHVDAAQEGQVNDRKGERLFNPASASAQGLFLWE